MATILGVAVTLVEETRAGRGAVAYGGVAEDTGEVESIFILIFAFWYMNKTPIIRSLATHDGWVYIGFNGWFPSQLYLGATGSCLLYASFPMHCVWAFFSILGIHSFGLSILYVAMYER